VYSYRRFDKIHSIAYEIETINSVPEKAEHPLCTFRMWFDSVTVSVLYVATICMYVCM